MDEGAPSLQSPISDSPPLPLKRKGPSSVTTKLVATSAPTASRSPYVFVGKGAPLGMSQKPYQTLTIPRPARVAPLWVAAVGFFAWVAALPAATAPRPAPTPRPDDRAAAFFES